MPIQIGRTKQVPIYEEVTTTGEVLSSSTLSNYFTITQGSSYGWSCNILSGSNIGLIESTPDNVGINSSTATITFEAVRDLSGVRIDYIYYTESNYDKITASIGDETLLNGVSGVAGPSDPTAGSISYENLVMNRTIYQGEKITFKYVKDISNSHTYESYTKFTIQCPPYTETTTEITGYEEKLLPQAISNLYLSPTKKVIGGWVKTSSAAKQFYGSLAFEYTGDYTMSTVTIGSTNYELYTLTSTGVLTLPKEAQVWACGGGGGGANGYKSGTTGYAGGGGGGGYVLEATTLQKGKYAVAIGAGGAGSSSGGATSIGNYSANGGRSQTASTSSSNGGNGGSGGGGGVYKSSSGNVDGGYGTGAGISTYPFGITELKAHCAGGGGGSVYGWNGYDGGTNGSNGTTTYSGESGSSSYIYYGGVGGEYGGGTGGTGYSSTSFATNGYAATFYGAGGGGAGLAGYGSSYTAYSGGSGYQGVAYILIQK